MIDNKGSGPTAENNVIKDNIEAGYSGDTGRTLTAVSRTYSLKISFLKKGKNVKNTKQRTRKILTDYELQQFATQKF